VVQVSLKKKKREGKRRKRVTREIIERGVGGEFTKGGEKNQKDITLGGKCQRKKGMFRSDYKGGKGGWPNTVVTFKCKVSDLEIALRHEAHLKTRHGE